MNFSQHGSYKLWVKERVIYAEISGAWNREAALNYSKEFKALASSFSGNWAHLVYLDDFELCGDEVFGVIQELVAWCIAQGLKRAAHVYSPSMVKKEFVGKMVAERQGEFTRAIFDNEMSARLWLSNEGYKNT